MTLLWILSNEVNTIPSKKERIARGGRILSREINRVLPLLMANRNSSQRLAEPRAMEFQRVHQSLNHRTLVHQTLVKVEALARPNRVLARLASRGSESLVIARQVEFQDRHRELSRRILTHRILAAKSLRLQLDQVVPLVGQRERSQEVNPVHLPMLVALAIILRVRKLCLGPAKMVSRVCGVFDKVVSATSTQNKLAPPRGLGKAMPDTLRSSKSSRDSRRVTMQRSLVSRLMASRVSGACNRVAFVTNTQGRHQPVDARAIRKRRQVTQRRALVESTAAGPMDSPAYDAVNSNGSVFSMSISRDQERVVNESYVCECSL